MTASAFARSLPDFARAAGRLPESLDSAAPPPPPPDPAALIASARAEGMREGEARAKAEFEAGRAAEATREAERLAEERRRWCEEESERLAAEFSAALRRLEADIASGVARVLSPFLAEEVRRGALEELARTVGELFTGGGGATVLVQGPGDLLERLRPRLEAQGAAFEFATTASADIRVTRGDTVVESQIAAWLDRLAATG